MSPATAIGASTSNVTAKPTTVSMTTNPTVSTRARRSQRDGSVRPTPSAIATASASATDARNARSHGSTPGANSANAPPAPTNAIAIDRARIPRGVAAGARSPRR